MTLAWDPNSESVAGYNVYRSTQSGVFSSPAVNGTAPLVATTYVDSVSQNGTYYYVVRAVSVDGKESASSNQVQVTIAAPPKNTAPMVTANSGGTYTITDTPTLTAVATDDGLPYGSLVYSWTIVSGTGVTFTKPNSLTTQLSFSAAGTSTLRITVSDGQLSSYADVVVTVKAVNSAPSVTASPGGTFTMTDTPTLTATATDDGLPYGSLTYRWTIVSGSGVTFTSPNSPTTQLSFSAAGTSTLRITASDGLLSSYADVGLTVKAATTTLTAPTGLISQCLNNGTFKVSWNPVNGAENYYLRVDDTANNVGSTWYVLDNVDFNIDAYPNTSFTGAVLPNQNYSWWVQGANSTVGLGPSTAASFTCADTAPPAVSITFPSTGTRVSGTVIVSASATDNYGIAGVQFKLDGSNLGSEVKAAPYSVSWETKTMSRGFHTLSAVARDLVGNQTTSSTVVVAVEKRPKLVTGLAGSESDAVSIGYARLGAEISEGVAVISKKRDGAVSKETAVHPSAPVRNGRVYVNADGPVDSGLIIANDSSVAAEISFYFTDPSGKDFGQGSFTVDAKTAMAAFVDEFPFNLHVPVEGALTFNSSIPVAAATLRSFTTDRGEFLVTTSPIDAVKADFNATSMLLPHFADGGGWSTEVILTNPSDVTLAGTIEFFSPDEAAHASAMTLSVNGEKDSHFKYKIAPRSFARFATSNDAGNIRSGYVRVTTDGRTPPPQGLSIFSFTMEGVKISEAVVPQAAKAASFHTIVGLSGEVRSALAIANTASTQAEATLELKTLDGSATGWSRSIVIPASGQVARFIDELFPSLPVGFEGMLKVSSTIPLGAASLRVRYNQRSGMIVTSVPVNDDSTRSGFLFPLIVTGSGYSTDFLGVKH